MYIPANSPLPTFDLSLNLKCKLDPYIFACFDVLIINILSYIMLTGCKEAHWTKFKSKRHMSVQDNEAKRIIHDRILSILGRTDGK